MKRNPFLRADGSERLVEQAIRHSGVVRETLAETTVARRQSIRAPTQDDAGGDTRLGPGRVAQHRSNLTEGR
jgi:hypothetical protein